MIDRTAAVLVIALGCAASGAALAAQPAAEPQMDTGYTNRSPRTPTVSEAADQIRAKAVIGADVRNPNGSEIAKISDLIVNRTSNAIELAVLQPTGGASSSGAATVAWGSLRFEGKPTPHFVTALSREALAAGRSFKKQARNGNDLYDVKADLLGKKAVGTSGAEVGRITDLVLTFESGRLVALVIDTGGLISVGAKHHAVAWDKANPQGGKGNAPLRLAVSKTEVDAAPVTATKAPEAAPVQSGNSTPVIRQDSTGNTSGSSIPAPANRR